ncbi:PREDICTED: uncharacterized protein LOC109588999 [Amphimedon queenslandica]|nr:PREDICTED: uncharacterized protein LOC109588999 [Amphimedon queenslandica]|eukprot:XP_019860680.1 PREDICTED: uncharacterized protein LOC109588999 [Amphimedon queenslandica]
MLEIVLQPMEDLWFQLGHQLKVEASLLSDIQETNDAKEQMRSLLQYCSDKGVTMMQLEEALEALDQKSLIPALQEFSKEHFTESNKKLELELKETKVALDACKFKQQEQEAVEEMLKAELKLKDEGISKLVKEKSQLSQMINELKQDGIKKQQAFVEQLDKITSEFVKEKSQLLEMINELKDENQIVVKKHVAELILKEKTISEFAKEKSQLLEMINELKQIEMTKQQGFVEQTTLKDKSISQLVEEKSQLLEMISKLQDKNSTEIEKQQSRVEQIQETQLSYDEPLESRLESIKQSELEAISYAGLIYYEERGIENLVTFTAARSLINLPEFVKRRRPYAEMGQCVYFHIRYDYEYIELIFDAPQDEPFTGWTIKPHMKPCRLYRQDIDNFDEFEYPLPPSCLISVYASTSPDTVPTLHYSIQLEGVVDPVALCINRALKPLAFSSTIASSMASSSAVTGTHNVKDVKKKLKKVLIDHQSSLRTLFQDNPAKLADELFQADIITYEVYQDATFDSMMGSFYSSMSVLNTKYELEEHCSIFLKALFNAQKLLEYKSKLGLDDDHNATPRMIQHDWIKAVGNELNLNH